MDAGQNIATYFQTKKAATIPQVRYYVTQDFLDAMGGSYKFDFRIQLWDRGTQSIVAEETITDTFTKAGWHVFTLETPFKVEAERVYAVSVFKGTNGYLCYGMVSEGSFGNVGNEYAEIPADGFGAWSGGATAWPNNSYELGGGRFWGVDPVFAD